ncbi:LysR family transcriptional regulator [Vibrio owensii]|uniref:LysR family transcriptional regulator n=1 Tax=Vibrio owensii TaxID=696485 RepID=UPI002F4296A5
MKNANISVMMLKALDSLRETGSISRTAEHLHVTQAAVSHAVKAIETVIETPIAVRGSRGVTLTAAGLAASESATIALSAINDILKLAGSSISGTVNVAAINCVSRVILSEILVNVRRTHPNLEINLFTGTDQEVEQIFIQELFDKHQHTLNIKTTVSDTAALFSIVASGYGTSLIPGLAFPDDWKKQVSRLRVSPTLRCELRLMCAADKSEHGEVRTLVDQIREVAKSKHQLI